MTMVRATVVLGLLGSLAACGGDDVINTACDEPQRYQRVVPGKRIEVPEGLNPLDELAEMPIPTAKDAPVRPPGSRCIELPPAAVTTN
ncbi:MAG: hypothetical protein KJO95_02080 [Gammaproteobacteria bacterium]|nr:hypothetical protein [Gammaproteobacteria bacterium]MBU2678190.1 hypothetical protein [Gammaproteobacteria bacterium]NNC56038.1 hypothetical protein [Woeseiaceae bacterium]NNL51925.1 hypothetical protein [Woeseiaceae bacterium]